MTTWKPASTRRPNFSWTRRGKATKDCKTWDFWEKHFQKAEGTNPSGALAILKLMVQREQDPERVKKATSLFDDLKRSHPGVVLTPPDEIRNAIEETQTAAKRKRFDELIADAGRLAKNRRYQDAQTTLDDADKLFPGLGRSDEKARKLHDDVQFQLALDDAGKSLERNKLDAAQTKVKEALQIRPKDKNAEELRDKIQSAMDKAEVEQHRQKAEKAVTAEDFGGAVDEILKAGQILEKPSNTPRSAPGRSPVDELAKTLIGKLHDQAKELSDRKQYDEAKKKLRLGLQLPSKDDRLPELLKEIQKLEADPKTANISGKWVTPNGAECKLTDSGTDTIRYEVVKLPQGIRSCVGGWTRTGDKLTGKFRVMFEAFPKVESDGTVRATIKDPQTLEVAWNTVYPDRPPIKGTWTWNGIGRGSWTKQ